MDLDPVLMLSILITESGGRPKSARFEANYYYYFRERELARLNKISVDTEVSMQKTSWGLMQVMGGVAREMGFNEFLPDLCDIKTGIKYGLIYFKRRCLKYPYVNDQIASYNAGSPKKVKGTNRYINQDYVDKVFSHVETATRLLNDLKILS